MHLRSHLTIISKDKWHIDKAKVKVEADVIATSIENMPRYTRIEEANRK